MNESALDEFKRRGFVLGADGFYHKVRTNNPGAQGDRGELHPGPQTVLPDGDTNLQEQQADDVMVRQGAEETDVFPGLLVGTEGHDQNPVGADNPAPTSGVDGPSHPQFRITITLRFATYRQKDPDGCLSTIMDCLKGAVRRCLDVVPGDNSKKRKVRSGQRGSDNPDRADKVKGKVPF
jgi:hypothetical protein